MGTAGNTIFPSMVQENGIEGMEIWIPLNPSLQAWIRWIHKTNQQPPYLLTLDYASDSTPCNKHKGTVVETQSITCSLTLSIKLVSWDPLSFTMKFQKYISQLFRKKRRYALHSRILPCNTVFDVVGPVSHSTGVMVGLLTAFHLTPHRGTLPLTPVANLGGGGIQFGQQSHQTLLKHNTHTHYLISSNYVQTMIVVWTNEVKH